jgi:sugar phosphate isomerase/epimerase
MIPVALQLYTLREEMAKDFTGILRKVAKIGYKGVEFAGYGDLSAEELKDLLDELGLKSAGSHVGPELLKNDIDEVIEFNKVIGTSYIVFPHATYESKEDYVEMAKFLNEVGKKVRENGMEFCYHNHAFEFTKYDGEYALDMLYRLTESENLQVELDTYWATYAGISPVEYIKKYSGRIPLIHLKDMEDSESRAFAEIGEGTIDIKAITAAGAAAGSKWFIVEQDKCKRPALESVKISLDNLKKMGLA